MRNWIDIIEHGPGCTCGGHPAFLAEAVDPNEPTIAPNEYPLKARYAEFNRLYFGGALPQIPLGFARMKGLGGRVDYKTKRETPLHPTLARIYGKHHGATLMPETLKLTISSDFRRPTHAFDSILLHEMIHVHFAVAGDFAEDHGAKFMRMAREISAKAQIEVPIQCPADWFKVPATLRGRPLLVVLIQNDGRGGNSAALVEPKFAEALVVRIGEQFQTQTEFSRIGMKVSVWAVNNPTWSAIALQMPVQRKIERLGFYRLGPDPAPIADLERDGKLMLTVDKGVVTPHA